MKYYKKYKIEVTEQELVKTICDRCGSAIPELRTYDLREFSLSFAVGDTFPDNGEKDGWEVEDLCDVCIGWLKNLLEENAVRITKVHASW